MMLNDVESERFKTQAALFPIQRDERTGIQRTTLGKSGSKTAFLLIVFGNRKKWNRGIVNGMQHFLGIGGTGRVSIYSFYSTTESGMAGRAGIAGIVTIDLDELWTFILK